MDRSRSWWIGTIGAILVAGSMLGYLTYTKSLDFRLKVSDGDTLTLEHMERTWKIQPESTVKLLVNSELESLLIDFPVISGYWTLNVRSPELMKGEVRADISTLNTGNRYRDETLKDWVYFYVKAYPEVTFQLDKVENWNRSWIEGKPNTMSIEGTLTVRNVSQKVIFPVEVLHRNNQIYVNGTGEINIQDFGITNILDPESKEINETKLSVQFVLGEGDTLTN
ncbi:YceI family protein [Paenibacillus sp. FJAT-26967]|uniref:YceI family protein n=1 Tax=Paenibacillus sp. FJAT-26967 TaxID=1729690 RepID=UPI0008396AA4|nr:YceI family protein [Paenibacillus sp. FJAT-26967]